MNKAKASHTNGGVTLGRGTVADPAAGLICGTVCGR